MLQHEGIQITWLGHDGSKLKTDRVISVDPYKLGSKAEPADLVFVTHEHFDHLSNDDSDLRQGQRTGRQGEPTAIGTATIIPTAIATATESRVPRSAIAVAVGYHCR